MAEEIKIEVPVKWLEELRTLLEQAAAPKVIYKDDFNAMKDAAFSESRLRSQIALNYVNDFLKYG